MLDHPLTIRAATPHDDGALQRLARSERRPRIGGRALLAERDGVAIAAVALTSGRVATDASSVTAEAVRRLRYRRYQLLRQSGGVGPAWSLLRTCRSRAPRPQRDAQASRGPRHLPRPEARCEPRRAEPPPRKLSVLARIGHQTRVT
jgi:hypothetical protein